MAANKYTGTQTEKNLQEAFTGESQARNKYTYFACDERQPGAWCWPGTVSYGRRRYWSYFSGCDPPLPGVFRTV